MNKQQVKHYCIQQVKHENGFIDVSGHSCRDCKFHNKAYSPGCGRSAGMSVSFISCYISETNITGGRDIFPFDDEWAGSEYLKWLVEHGD